jgi:hypothetical protein
MQSPSVAKFVLQILDGSIAQMRSYIAAPFWIEDGDGSGDKTWNGPIALSVLFEITSARCSLAAKRR